MSSCFQYYICGALIIKSMSSFNIMQFNEFIPEYKLYEGLEIFDTEPSIVRSLLIKIFPNIEVGSSEVFNDIFTHYNIEKIPLNMLWLHLKNLKMASSSIADIIGKYHKENLTLNMILHFAFCYANQKNFAHVNDELRLIFDELNKAIRKYIYESGCDNTNKKHYVIVHSKEIFTTYEGRQEIYEIEKVYDKEICLHRMFNSEYESVYVITNDYSFRDFFKEIAYKNIDEYLKVHAGFKILNRVLSMVFNNEIPYAKEEVKLSYENDMYENLVITLDEYKWVYLTMPNYELNDLVLT